MRSRGRERPPVAALAHEAVPIAGFRLAPLRFGGDHRHAPVLVDRKDLPLGASKPTQERLPMSNDRMSLRPGFDLKALAQLGF